MERFRIFRSKNKEPERLPPVDPIQRIKGKVEEALQELNKKQGRKLLRLSTDPAKVGELVNQGSLFNQCRNISEPLQDILENSGVPAHLAVSRFILNNRVYLNNRVDEFKATSDHTYLIVDEKNEDILIDPTIGQFVLGHNHTFVGTRDSLRQIVFSQRQLQIPKHIFLKTGPDMSLLFEWLWGNTSINVKREKTTYLPI